MSLNLIQSTFAADESIKINTDLGLQGIIEKAVGVFLLFGGLAIFGMFLYSGYLFITSQGNAEKITTARNVITYAIVGVVIVALSYAIMIYLFQGIKK